MTRDAAARGVTIRLDGVEPVLDELGARSAGVVLLVDDGRLHDVDVVIGQAAPRRQEDEPDGHTEKPDEDSAHQAMVDRTSAGG
jgi:hypothetical protein